jgi:iron complex outermembrane receptor protein
MLFVLTLAGLAAPAAAQTGTITGRVTTSENSSAVANAEIHAISAGRTVAQSLTNTDGRYRLTVPAGTYNVHVEMVGYEAVIRPSIQVSAGGSTSLDVVLTPAVFQLNPVVVTASKRTEKATEAPAHVDVVSERDIASRPTVTPVDHIRNTPGVDVVTSGVQSTNVVVRGFNNIFSGSLHALTDHRIAGIPSLRVNFLHFIAAGDDDLQRVEVVLGPGSALYGPNTAHGVMHMITKSPLTEQGTTVSVSGGTQDLMQVSFRTAQKFSDRLGFKISGNYMQAKEWEYNDPTEQSERQKFATDPTQIGIFERSFQISRAEADRRIGLIGNRDFDVERWSSEARADLRATDRLTLVLQGGLTNIGKGVELTGLGAGQALDWKSSYVQTRANMGRLFGQVYLNMSDAGDTYLLRNGAPIVDKSKLLVAQLQHGYALTNWADFTYGFDYLKTTPETEGSINGIYEDDDETTEVGGYLQAQLAVHPKLDLVLAGRVDDHSALPDPIFSPRAGIVFKVAENRAIRLTYNRAFSTPSSLNQFLDLSSAFPDPNGAALGYSVRVQGTGTEGFKFGTPGSYTMRSPLPGGDAGNTVLPASASALWDPAVAVVISRAGLPAQVAGPLLNYLTQTIPNPTEAQIATTYRDLASGATGLLSTLTIPAIKPIRESTTSTVELGYRGVISNRLLLAGDIWGERLENFVTPLTAQTPLLFHDRTQTSAFLQPRLEPFFTGAFMQAGAPAAVAQQMARDTAAKYAPLLGAGIAQIPVGVITSPDMHATGAQVLTTYYNVEDQIELWGVDMNATYLLSDNLSIGGTASFVNKDVFTSQRGESITLNAPKTKWATHAAFRKPEWGFDTELRVRYNDSFPVRSGVYNGTLCIDGKEPGAEDCVKSYTLVDVNASYRIPGLRGATVQAYIQNLLDEDYRSYPGVPTIGRMILTRLKYTF